jgi:hypothetical protein
MSNIEIIKAQWETYYLQILVPAKAGAIQVQECRRAFYAGANALLSSIMGLLQPGTEPTPADMDMMDNIEQEFRRFARDISEGRA